MADSTQITENEFDLGYDKPTLDSTHGFVNDVAGTLDDLPLSTM